MNQGKVVIPARYDSSRFPGKPLVDIYGKPMIQHVYEKCVEAVGAKMVVVATDSNLIKNTVENFNGKVQMTSGDCLTGTDRLAEVNSVLNLDFIVNVQGDEPLTRPDHVRKLFDLMQKDSSHVLNCFCELSKEEIDLPSVPKVVVSHSLKLLYMSRGGLPFDKTLRSHAKYKQVCIYGFSRKHLKLFSSQQGKSKNENFEDIEILRFLDLDVPVQMIEVSSGGVAVDTPEDLVRVKKLMLRKFT